MLCQACGLCCDGSLFGRVQLAEHEVDGARRNGLRVLPSGRTFEQPCSALGGSALGGDRACACYDERPERCRVFVCRLLDRVTRGDAEPAAARVRLARARVLLDRVTSGDGLEPSEVDELTGYLDADLARAD